jgi:hypothetical protein
VDQEYRSALTACGRQVNERMMTKSACLVRLTPKRQELWMDRRGDRLRRGLDRQHRLILSWLQAILLAYLTESNERRPPAGELGAPLKQHCQTQEVNWNHYLTDRGENDQTQKSFRISKNRTLPKPKTQGASV